MKKVLLFITMLSSVLLSSSIANAAESKVIDGHQLVPGTTFYQGETVSVKSSYESAYGAYTEFNLVSKGSLPSYLANNNDREIYFDVWEYDVAPNADDKIVAYRSKFRNRQIQKEYVYTRYVTGSGIIDSEGDPTVELYVKARLPKVSGDSVQSTGKFYTYKLIQR